MRGNAPRFANVVRFVVVLRFAYTVRFAAAARSDRIEERMQSATARHEDNGNEDGGEWRKASDAMIVV